MLEAGTPHSPLIGVSWAKPNSVINDSPAILDHESSQTFFFSFKKKGRLIQKLSCCFNWPGGNTTEEQESWVPGACMSLTTKSTTLNVKGQAEKANLI